MEYPIGNVAQYQYTKTIHMKHESEILRYFIVFIVSFAILDIFIVYSLYDVTKPNNRSNQPKSLLVRAVAIIFISENVIMVAQMEPTLLIGGSKCP